jgi:hypothetical protein
LLEIGFETSYTLRIMAAEGVPMNPHVIVFHHFFFSNDFGFKPLNQAQRCIPSAFSRDASAVA